MLGNMFKDDGPGDPGSGPQIQKTGKPSVVLMTAGGNNARFGDVADNCVYRNKPENTPRGPLYEDDPNGVGKCKQSLQWTQDYFDRPEESDFSPAIDFRKTLIDLMTTDQARSNDPFYLYVVGYPKFSNDEDPVCDTYTFTPYTPGFNDGFQFLNRELRQHINRLSVQFNQIYVGNR